MFNGASYISIPAVNEHRYKHVGLIVFLKYWIELVPIFVAEIGVETLQKGLPEIISWWKYTNTPHMLCRKVEAEAKPPEKADAVRKAETAEYGAWKDQWQRSKDDWQWSWQSSEDNWWNSKLLSCTWLPAFAPHDCTQFDAFRNSWRFLPNS